MEPQKKGGKGAGPSDAQKGKGPDSGDQAAGAQTEDPWASPSQGWESRVWIDGDGQVYLQDQNTGWWAKQDEDEEAETWNPQTGYTEPSSWKSWEETARSSRDIPKGKGEEKGKGKKGKGKGRG